MSSNEYRFIEPLDVLFLRGNKLFGDPGSYGEALVPPWPSVVSGAIRSRMLVDDNVDLAAFSRNESPHPSLGTPAQPGNFAINAFHLARRKDNGIEILVAPSADLVISELKPGHPVVTALAPQILPAGLQTSSALPLLPVLAQGSQRSKPVSGYWLTQAGWASYLNGDTPEAETLVHSSSLWAFDARVGIGMSTETRSVEEGKLFSAQAIAMKKSVGFLAVVSGASPPTRGLLRFGGDGRAATIERIDNRLPEPDYEAISKTGRCRIVLTSPGLFREGSQLPGTSSDNFVTLPGGLQAKLVAASVPRAETVSGWDLARKQPKPAQRIAPTGSVYWLDEMDATAEQLRHVTENGLWDGPLESDEHPAAGSFGANGSRSAEGFNRCAIGAWV